jgi:hypothetical protein
MPVYFEVKRKLRWHGSQPYRHLDLFVADDQEVRSVLRRDVSSLEVTFADNFEKFKLAKQLGLRKCNQSA